MLTKEEIIKIAGKKDKITTAEIAKQFGVSRQYASGLINELVAEKRLIKVGSTRSAFYVLSSKTDKLDALIPSRIKLIKQNSTGQKLEEHEVLNEVELRLPVISCLPENIKSIFTYAFSEMLNNAIDHSKSQKIVVEVGVDKKNKKLSFVITDFGIGVFRNVKEKRRLNSELEAIQDLLKGKTTTAPKMHSGEGIFFTSKVGDVFELESFGDMLMIDNKNDEMSGIGRASPQTKGTRVNFEISTDSKKHLNDIFKKFTNLDDAGGHGFDKTEIKIKLFTMGGVHISRSQARRILSGLEKFKIVVFDFEGVPLVGQAFADEIFRVFQNTHPKIKLIAENMNDAVTFMVERALNEAER